MGNLTIPFKNNYTYSLNTTTAKITINNVEGGFVGEVSISTETGIKIASGTAGLDIVFYNNPSLGSNPFEFVTKWNSQALGVRQFAAANNTHIRWVIGIEDLRCDRASLIVNIEDPAEVTSITFDTTNSEFILRTSN